jgi:hypothetical protein
MPEVNGEADREEVVMRGARTVRTSALLALLAGTLFLLALVPASALAAWRDVSARIVDPRGTGVVPVLNVDVLNHAVNDSSRVSTVQFSDDGRSWYAVPYTGRACGWVLGGGAGHKRLFVRFGAADGSFSPVVAASIDVDTTGPATVARSARRASGGRTTFRFAIKDSGSARVDATLVVRGKGVVRRLHLGRVARGVRQTVVRLGLRKGVYSWRVEAVDLAGRTQVKQVAARLVIR